MAVSLNEIAKLDAQTGDTKSALGSYTEALQIRRDIGDKRGVGSTLLDLGNLYDDKGDHDKALDYYKQSLQIEREIGDESMQAICLNNIGNARFAKGDYEDALTYFQQALQLREKAKAPDDIVESVHNIAETSAKMGQFDQAVTQYMRALDLRRSMSDPRGAAIESYSLGTLFQNQGRFGAALNSKEEALKTFTDLKDRTFWMAEILSGYGDILIEVGRSDEAPKYLDDALNLSRELKNDGLAAQTLVYQGDAALYRGDFKAAKGLYERASQTAERTTETDKKLIAKLNLAKLAVQEGRSREAIASLRLLAQKAEALGLKYVAVQCSLLMAEAMVQVKDYGHAKPELEQTLLRSDKLGLQPLSAKADFLLATISRASGNSADAQDHYRQVVRLLEAMSTQKGAEKVLQRSDWSAMYAEAKRGAGK
jgi:tetratricopeptide (TPR) repeat protein